MSNGTEHRVSSAMLVAAAKVIRSRGESVTRSAIAKETGYEKKAVRNILDRQKGLKEKVYWRRCRKDNPPPSYLSAVLVMTQGKLSITQKSLAARLGIALGLLKKRLRQYPHWRELLKIRSEAEVRRDERLEAYTSAARRLFVNAMRVYQSSLVRETGIPLDTVNRDFSEDERFRSIFVEYNPTLLYSLVEKDESRVTYKALSRRLGIPLRPLKARLKQYPKWRKLLMRKSEAAVKRDKRLLDCVTAARALFAQSVRVNRNSLSKATGIPYTVIHRDFAQDERFFEIIIRPSRKRKKKKRLG